MQAKNIHHVDGKTRFGFHGIMVDGLLETAYLGQSIIWRNGDENSNELTQIFSLLSRQNLCT